jgi:site-specific DNA-methyltransferase (adenine-specific)
MSQIVINGNNIDILKTYPDNYFDAVVTDPPYGLGKEPNAAELMKDWIEHGYHEVSGSGFMGKEWDAFVPQPVFWKEVFRVLKHGGHVLSFFGTRTYDWGVMSMRFAGFEVRDCIQWLYGSGFPKSHNISKALDKLEGAEREIIGDKVSIDGRLLSSRVPNAINKYQSGFNTYSDLIYNTKITAPSTEAAKQWDGWGSALKPANEPIVLARKPLEKGLSIAENILKWGVGGINIDATRIGFKDEADYKESTQKNQHADFGTKPLTNNNVYGDYSMVQPKNYQPEGRFPANIILTHHPECECKGTKKVKAIKGGNSRAIQKNTYNDFGKNYDNTPNGVGCGFGDENGKEEVENWDCHEDCPIRILDEQSGILKSGKLIGEYNGFGNNGIYGKSGLSNRNYESDSGGASRFFYCAKASKSERNKGLEQERWFYDLELVLESISFTEQNLFIWESEELNQNMDLNGEAQQKKDISEGIVLLVEDKECYTTLFGKGKEVLFPKAIKFTTSMGIKQTIELKTLNYYQPLSINDSIADVIETNKENGLNLAENVGLKNILKLIFTKEKTGFPHGVRLVVKKMPQLINVKEVWKKSNIHSTVKPIKLMQYLVKMITPPNGIVLDPFCGSGTTGVACKLEGFQFVGMEQDPEYSKIAEGRIKNYKEEKEKTPKNKPKEDKQPINTQTTLF